MLKLTYVSWCLSGYEPIVQSKAGLTLGFRQKKAASCVVFYFLTMCSSQSLTSFDPG